MIPFTFRDVLHGLENCKFENYEALLEAIRKQFNKHVLDLPPGFTHFDVLERGIEKQWIKVCPDRTYVIQTGSAQSSPTLIGAFAG